MGTISVINKSQLEGALRIDAEYYQSNYLALAVRLRERHGQTLKLLKAELDGSAFYPSIADIYMHSGVPFLRIDDIQNGYVNITSDSVFLPSSVLEENKSTIARCFPGDIVIAKGGNTIGKVGMVQEDYPEYSVCRDLIVVRTSLLQINRFFVLAYLLSHYGQTMMIRTASQTGQPHLTLVTIRELLIPALRNDFQSRVERALRESASLLRNAANKYREAEGLLLADLGLEHWDQPNSLTYTRNYSEVVQSRRFDAEHFHPKYQELRRCIRNYQGGYCRITDIASNSDETFEPRSFPEQYFRYIELAGINQRLGTIEIANHMMGKHAPSRARMLLRSGDVVASAVEGSLDKAAIVSAEYEGAIGSTGFFVLRPRNVPSGYLLALTKSIIVSEQMHCEASGTILAAVSPKSLQNILVPKIPAMEMGRIAELVHQSHEAARKTRQILASVNRAISIAIDEGEDLALALLRDEQD